MTALERVAFLGTGQTPAEGDLSGSPVDGLVSKLGGLDRERALLLRAGGHAVLRRSAAVLSHGARRLEPAPVENLGTPSAALTERLAGLLAGTDRDLLFEALDRMAKARIRLPEELLPSALSVRAPEERERLRPLLGARGVWLAPSRPEWTWALSPHPDAGAPPADVRTRWEDATSAERETLLAMLRRAAPELGRELVAASIKQEKAETRAAWLEVLSRELGAADAPLLIDLLGDRSQLVRRSAARLLWRIPETDVATRMRSRAEALFSFDTGGGLPEIALPPEEFDADWEKDGVAENAPVGGGRRQWWLAQVLSAPHPDHWTGRFELAPEKLLAAVSVHDLAEAVLDGLTAAALRHGAAAWFAPLWDVWTTKDLTARLTENPVRALAGKLSAEEAVPRMLTALGGAHAETIAYFSRPWPRKVAAYFVEHMATPRARWTPLLAVAAAAIPAELLPEHLPVPDVPADYAAHQYLRSLDHFQAVSSVRRAIAKEIPL